MKKFFIKNQSGGGLSPQKSHGPRTGKTTKNLKIALLISFALTCQAQADEIIVSDRFDVGGGDTGFSLNKGVNSMIKPPHTRLTGSAVENLRYLQTALNRPPSHFSIQEERLRIKPAPSIARFTLSDDGSNPFDFGPVLKTDHASKANKIVYDVRIGMRNDSTTAARVSFGIATSEGDVNKMDFAIQLYRAKQNDSHYTIQKRFDRGSYRGATTPGEDGDLNEVMKKTAPGTVGRMIDFLIRVTDAGAEGAFVYNSRIQVSLDDGASWIYDTEKDGDLPDGFRLDGTSRYFVFDQAANKSGDVWYDDFSVTVVSKPTE